MLAPSKTDSLTARFEPYIQELREFFTSRDHPFGNPKDLATLLDRLHDPGFHEEMVSMVRSILYREETLPRIEIMEIIAVAAGGPQILDDAAELHQPLRGILSFVQEVARAKSGFVPAQAAPVDEDARTAEANADNTSQSRTAESIGDEIPVADPPHFALTNDHLAQSLDFLQNSHKEPPPVTTRESNEQPAAVRAVALAPRLVPTRPTLAAVLRRSYWIPGVVVLLLAIAAGTYLRQQTPRPMLPRASNQHAPIVSGQSKPTAYGNTLDSPHHLSPYPGDVAPDETALPEVSSPRTYTSSPPRAAAPAHPATASPRLVAKEPPPPPRPAAINPLAPREGVFLASSGAMASHLLSAPAPGYPELAKITRTEGQVIVQVVVGRDGRVAATRVLDGPHLLRSAAEHAIHKWRYRPYLVDGRPTDVATIVTVSFRLR